MANLYLSVKGQTLTVKSDIDKIVENSINYLKINIDTSQDSEWSDPDLNIKCILSNKEKSSTFYENNYITEDFLKAPGFVVHLVGYELNEDGETYKKLIPTNPVVVNIHSTGVLEADPEPDKEIAAEWVDKVVSSVNESINQLKQEQSIFIEETNTKITFIENKAGEALEKTNENSLGIKAIADNSANAIKENVSGSFIRVDDVSPIEHNLSVKVDKPNVTVSRYGKNLFPSFDSLVGTEKNGVTLSKVDDYYVLHGTATKSANFIINKIHFDAGTYTISANNTKTVGSKNALVQIYSHSYPENDDFLAPDHQIDSFKTITIPTASDYECRIRVQNGVFYDQFKIKPQLEVGTVATEHEPYKGVQTAVSNENGIVEGLTSLYPNMTLTGNDVTIECEYNKDLIKYVEQNTQIEIPENVETTNNKVTVIDATITDDTKYPSAKAVYDLFSTFEPSGDGDIDISENVETTNALFSKYSPFTRIIDDCQDATKWTITNTSSELESVDTTNYIFGDQSLRSDGTMRSIKNTYDLANNYLVLKLRINSIGTGSRLLLSIGNTSAPSTRVVYELGRGTSWTTPEEWQEIVVSSSNYSYGSADAIDFSNINDLYFITQTLSGTGTAEVDWNLQYVGTRPKTTNKGIVTFTFDDGWSSQYTGVKLLAEKGITSTLFTIKEAVESNNYLTLDEIKSLVNLYGADIEVHGDPAYTNPIWTEDKLKTHWSESQKFIRENGLGEGRHLAYPNGMFPENVVELTKDYFDSCRTITPFIPIETLPVADRYRIRAVSSVGEGVKVNTIKQYIDRMSKDGGWLVLVLHKIGNAVGDTMYCSEEDLSAIADYAIDSGVDIMNYAEVMERFYADLSPEKDTTVSGEDIVIPENVETTDNKVSTIEDNAAEDKYPTVSAVRDYVNKYKHITPITEDTFIFDLDDGIYHIDGGSGATIYFDAGGSSDCNLQDGLFLVSSIADIGTYNWIAIGRNSNGVEGVFTGYTDDSWTAHYSIAEKEDNKVSIINDITNNNTYYPTVKAVTEYVEETIQNNGSNNETITPEKLNPELKQWIRSGIINVKDYGAVGDGVTDDTDAIQRAVADVSDYKMLMFPKGHYIVKPDANAQSFIKLTGLKNVSIELNDSTLEVATNEYPQYNLFELIDCENFILTNGVLKGDRLTHNYADYPDTPAIDTHEFGYGILVRSSSTVTSNGTPSDTLKCYGKISNCKIFDFTGDGIVTKNGMSPGKIEIINCEIHHCRRQGISVLDSDDIVIDNCYVHHIGSFDSVSGASPKSGIDIEPATGTSNVNSVFIKNTTIEETSNDSIIAVTKYDFTELDDGNREVTKVYSTIQNITIENCHTGVLTIRCHQNTDINDLKYATINIKDCVLNHSICEVEYRPFCVVNGRYTNCIINTYSDYNYSNKDLFISSSKLINCTLNISPKVKLRYIELYDSIVNGGTIHINEGSDATIRDCSNTTFIGSNLDATKSSSMYKFIKCSFINCDSYPSEQKVQFYDCYLDRRYIGKANYVNCIITNENANEISENASDAQSPSAKAVYKYGQTILTALQGDLDNLAALVGGAE